MEAQPNSIQGHVEQVLLLLLIKTGIKEHHCGMGKMGGLVVDLVDEGGELSPIWPIPTVANKGRVSI